MIKKSFYLTIVTTLLLFSSCFAKEIYVSPKGNDSNSGTKSSPYLSFEKALEQVKRNDKKI